MVLPSALKLKIKLNDAANIFIYAEHLTFKDMSEHHKHTHFLLSLRLVFLCVNCQNQNRVSRV